MSGNSINTPMPRAINKGGTNATTKQAAFDNLSPTTTKGDLIAYGSSNNRVGVGSDGQVFLSDTAQTTGWKWAAYPGTVSQVAITSSTLDVSGSPVTSKGTINVNVPLSAQGANLLYNSQFLIWQRNTSFSINGSATVYTTDRWQASAGASTNITVSQVAGTVSGSFLAQIQRNSSNTGTAAIRLCQSLPISACFGAASSKLSLQFKALSGANFSAASGALTVKVYTGTGSSDISGINGAFTGSSAVINTTVTLSSTLSTFTLNCAAIGSTVTQLAVEFSYSGVGTAGANDYFQVTDVQLEIAPNATLFRKNSKAWHLSKCQAHYCMSFNQGTPPAQNVGTSTGETYALLVKTVNAGTQNLLWVNFPGPMLGAPTVTLYNPSAGNAQVRNLTNSADWSSCSAHQVSRKGFFVQGTTDSGGAAGNQIIYHWTAEYELT